MKNFTHQENKRIEALRLAVELYTKTHVADTLIPIENHDEIRFTGQYMSTSNIKLPNPSTHFVPGFEVTDEEAKIIVGIAKIFSHFLEGNDNV